MTKSKYFIPVMLLLLSTVVSLIGGSMKLGGTGGSSVLLAVGLLAQFVSIVWFVLVLLGVKRRRVG